ncbi:MAG TPA: hypothetical protein VNF73_11480 [Candidatus Saccharimonadales bacterium]|nr:hypothetical protein [Candidatus Saccharimonadales bacterium]
MEAAVRVAEAGGFVNAEIRARNNLGSVIWDTDPRRALEMYVAARELALRLGNRGMANWSLGSITPSVFFAAGDWDAVISESTEAIESVRGSIDEALLAGTRALMLAARGEPTDESLARLEALAGQVSDLSVAAQMHQLRAARAMQAGQAGRGLRGMDPGRRVRAVGVGPPRVRNPAGTLARRPRPGSGGG